MLWQIYIQKNHAYSRKTEYEEIMFFISIKLERGRTMMTFNLKKKTEIILITCCIMLLISTLTAHAATNLMEYNGTGIRQKSSVNSFTLNKKTTFTVKHNTTGVTYIGKNSPSKYTLNIYLQKKSGLQYSNTGDSFSLKGVGSKNKKWTKNKGTYRLYFQSPYPGEGKIWAGFNINGKIVK